MKIHKYAACAAILYFTAGCARLREWEARGSPDNLPPSERARFYQQQRQRDLENLMQNYNWMLDERR